MAAEIVQAGPEGEYALIPTFEEESISDTESETNGILLYAPTAAQQRTIQIDLKDMNGNLLPDDVSWGEGCTVSRENKKEREDSSCSLRRCGNPGYGCCGFADAFRYGAEAFERSSLSCGQRQYGACHPSEKSGLGAPRSVAGNSRRGHIACCRDG